MEQSMTVAKTVSEKNKKDDGDDVVKAKQLDVPQRQAFGKSNVKNCLIAKMQKKRKTR